MAKAQPNPNPAKVKTRVGCKTFVCFLQMSSSIDIIARDIVEKCLEIAMDEVDMEYIFKKGHASPVYDSSPDDNARCHEHAAVITNCEDLCSECYLPMDSEIPDFELTELDIASSKRCKSCECCLRTCTLKSNLFDAIGEALSSKDDDIEQTARNLQHVRGDLVLALREVSWQLSHLISD